MKVRAQFAFVFNLDKCIGCHTCSVTCKNTWTNRKGVEYVWFNNVESKPGIGYPKQWENQEKWKGGWTLNGGTASESWSLEYRVGSETAELKRSRHSTLAALTRLHKASAGGLGWRILGDSFAIGMILLGLSGLLLWARGRTLKQMVLSVASVSALALLTVLLANLF